MQPRRWRAGHKPGKMQSAESEVDTTLSEQDKCEIRKSYRNALAPRQHVKILMELYLASREEIEERWALRIRKYGAQYGGTRTLAGPTHTPSIQ